MTRLVRVRAVLLSGASTHADRVATIARLEEATGVVVDPHTADALTVAWAYRAGMLTGAGGATIAPSSSPIAVMETALPVKFSATIVEALGREPERPEKFVGIEDLPRHTVALSNDVEALKALIVERLG